MPTKAQAFRTQQQRNANPPKPKRPKRPRRDTTVDTAQPGVSASDRKVGDGNSGTRNVSKRAEQKGGARLEDSATGKPSRKSTRKSAGRVKRTSNLQREAVRKTASPKAKATRAKGQVAKAKAAKPTKVVSKAGKTAAKVAKATRAPAKGAKAAKGGRAPAKGRTR